MRSSTLKSIATEALARIKQLYDVEADIRGLPPQVRLELEGAVEAMKRGAYDFVQKPFDNETLKQTLARALDKISTIKEKEA